MSIRLAFELSLVGLIATVGMMALALLLVKGLRQRRARRRLALVAEMRPRVLAAMDDEGEVTQFRGRGAAVAEGIAIGLLPSLRGADRRALAEVLEAAGVIEHALAGLSSMMAARRERSAEVLGAAGATAAIPLLIARLGDRDAGVRMMAARSLGRIGDGAAVAPLLEALGERRVPAGTISLSLLRIGSDGAPALLAALESPVARTRVVAAEVAGSLGLMEAGDRLERLLDDGDLVVRTSAVRALGRLGAPGSVPVLVARLEDVLAARDAPREQETALSLISALGHLGDPSAIPALTRALARSHRLSFAAAAALACIAPGRSQRPAGLDPDGASRALAPLVAILTTRGAAAAEVAVA